MDISKLPQWAQRRISKLESDVDYWRAKAEVGPEGSNTFLHDYNDDSTVGGTPLGTGVDIRFDIPGGDDYILAHLEGNAVQIHAGSRLGNGLIVRPQSSNTLRIEVA